MIEAPVRQEAFEALCRRVQACFACQDMAYVHVLAPSNGSLRAEAMFIGEAPGRLGAALSGVPFTSDQSGRRFQRLLEAAGLDRSQVFLTNALLCNPLREGKNRPPRRREAAACSRWLKAQVDLVDPPLVVALGTVALAALRLIEDHPYRLPTHVGQALPWYGRTLMPLYHPSPRTVGQRPWLAQVADFRRLGKLLRPSPTVDRR